ncbi:MAG TPA: M23 family metallopeptidase [Sandaracinaceae bacterium LLY-WYZ-13_1]|nr:M23 family metallopeptidase [Sandaracinaceae bacterium LLY-WYZ-13_1]
MVTLALILVGPSTAAADPSDRAARDARPRHDYSRFSDGPRRVPTPRGASLRRARHLGLGTREAASRILHQPIPERWMRAADWRGREVDRLLWPVDDGNYVRGFGFVRRTRPDLRHDGVDISAPVGTVVRAAADGIVAYSDNGIRGYGNCVILVHPNGWATLYAHNSRTTVQPGWRVHRGERIALVGNTGISRGPHVHFELHRDGRAVDPLALFDGGPAFVRRVARRAHAAGRVPAPQPLRAEDRRTPPPLPPWTGEAPRAAAAEPDDPPAADAEGGAEGGTVDRVGRLAVGSRRLLRRLLRFRPSEAMTDAAGGRVFSNLLWPVRGGRVADHDERSIRIAAERGSAVRAAADGLVVYAGRLGRRGRTVVMLHRMGWVTVYASAHEIHVEPGQRVRRGEWIASTGHSGRGATDRLDFEVRVDGRRADPLPMLVHVPEN